MSRITVGPCPFCGSPNVEHEEPQKDRFFAVVCQECDASGPLARSTYAAIALWNHRPGPAAGRADNRPDLMTRLCEEN